MPEADDSARHPVVLEGGPLTGKVYRLEAVENTLLRFSASWLDNRPEATWYRSTDRMTIVEGVGHVVFEWTEQPDRASRAVVPMRS